MRSPAPSRREDDGPVLDRLCELAAYHPRWTCFAICLLCLSAGWLDRVLP